MDIFTNIIPKNLNISKILDVGNLPSLSVPLPDPKILDGF